MSDSKFCSYRTRNGKQYFDTDRERELMKILIEFGESIDPHGYDDGDYDTAMEKLLAIVSKADQ